MISACQAIWKSADQPAGQRGNLAEDILGMCALCGHDDERTVPLTVACPPASFGGWQQMRWPSSDRVCRACTWAMEGKPPNTLRMWSTLYREDGVRTSNGPELGPRVGTLNRADLSPVLETLCFPPSCRWAVGIAESGKVHIVPYIPMNSGSGVWSIRVDRVNVHASAFEFRRVVHNFAVLAEAGYSARAIINRNPSTRDLVKNGIEVWRENISALGPTAGQIERLVAMMVRKENASEWRERSEARTGT